MYPNLGIRCTYIYMGIVDSTPTHLRLQLQGQNDLLQLMDLRAKGGKPLGVTGSYWELNPWVASGYRRSMIRIAPSNVMPNHGKLS